MTGGGSFCRDLEHMGAPVLAAANAALQLALANFSETLSQLALANVE